jgi:putative SOS response-associated peptidase YedK
MPVILNEQDYPVWLSKDRLESSEMFRPYPSELLDEYVVSNDVNRPRNDRRENTIPV